MSALGPSFDVAFDLALPHGRCVAVALAPERMDAALAALHPEERERAAAMPSARRLGFVGGRVAMRRALAGVSAVADAPIASDERGAPILPRGVVGSISHKESIAVALASRAAGDERIGVDVELDVAPRTDIARRVLRAEEMRELDAMEESARAAELILRFSAKEAIYKAVDPFVRRYVAFGEAYVAPRADGSAEARLELRVGEPRFAVEVRWIRRDALVVTSARVTLAP